jgi:predicted nucleic acid-binding protein
MAKFVLDASGIIEFLIPGPWTIDIRAFIDKLTADDQVFVPEFCLLECTNVIWKHTRFNGMPQAVAEDVLNVLQSMPLATVPSERLLMVALQIAFTNTLSVYDCVYIALARDLQCPLVSLDRMQRRAAQAEHVDVMIQMATK